MKAIASLLLICAPTKRPVEAATNTIPTKTAEETPTPPHALSTFIVGTNSITSTALTNVNENTTEIICLAYDENIVSTIHTTQHTMHNTTHAHNTTTTLHPHHVTRTISSLPFFVTTRSFQSPTTSSPTFSFYSCSPRTPHTPNPSESLEFITCPSMASTSNSFATHFAIFPSPFANSSAGPFKAYCLNLNAYHFDETRVYRRLLVQLEETERRFDDFWNTHLMRLKQCLDLRLFEQDFRELQVKLA